MNGPSIRRKDVAFMKSTAVRTESIPLTMDGSIEVPPPSNPCCGRMLAPYPFPDPTLPPLHSAVTTKPQTAPSAVPSVPILDSDSCPEKPPQTS